MARLMLLLHQLAAPLRHGDDGQGLVEYTLLVALIAFVLIATVTTLGQTIITKLYTLAGSF